MYQYEVIHVAKLPFIKHEILILPSGRATHNSPDKNIEVVSVADAIGRCEIVSRRIIYSHLSEPMLLVRAERLAKSRRYELLYNCEDYIAELCGKRPASKQRNFWIFVSFLGLGLVAARQ